MAIRVKCPGCGKTLEGGDDYAGERVLCPSCGGSVRLPPAKPKVIPTSVPTKQPVLSDSTPDVSISFLPTPVPRTPISKPAIDFVKRHRRAVTTFAIIIAATLLLIWLAVARPFAHRYTVVNAGNGKVYKVDRRTGESWLLSGTREIPVGARTYSPLSPEERSQMELDSAISEAQTSYVLTQAVNRGSLLSNNGTIQQTLERDHYAKIKGWSGQKIDEDTYLVSFKYDNGAGKEFGYYFEVNDAADTVRNIFYGGGLYERYAKYGINPAYMLGHDAARTPIPNTTNGGIVWDDWKDDAVVDSKKSQSSR